MRRDDWFRNTSWDSSIEANFMARLSRARDKAQCMRIQASILAKKYPEVSLKLIDQYFMLGKRFDDALAYFDKATAFLSLNEIEKVLESYEDALSCEVQHPSVLTQAYLDLPFLVAVKGIKGRYEHALLILDRHKSRLLFPVDYFLWNSAYALIQNDSGNIKAAREYAIVAIHAASQDQSGFRYHPNIGLVGNTYDTICKELAHIVK